MVIHTINFSDNSTYLDLYNLIFPFYTTNPLNQTDQIYLYNQDTKVVYVLDYRVYYRRIGYERANQEVDIYDLPMTSYTKMPGADNKYSQKEILSALRQNQKFYFPDGQMKHDKVNGQTRAIALFCEAIRFTAIHRALLRGAMSEGTSWRNSWGTLANNWNAITNGQFTIPVPDAAICTYMELLPADTPTRIDFRNTINFYLASPCPLD